mgnify:CR=1 FL=1
MRAGQSKEQILKHIAELVQKIQKDEKIGTAYEKYNTQYLWELGDSILQYRSFAEDKEDTAGEIMQYLQSRSVRCVPVLLKNAETARRAWATSQDYLRAARDVSYGKLKAALPIFDLDFVSHARVEKGDLDCLAEILRGSTYEQVLEHIRRLRQKYDSRCISVNFDELYSDLYAVTESLAHIAVNRDSDAIRAHRGKYSPKFIEDTRRLIAEMKNEDMFQKLSKSIPRKFRETLDTREPNFDSEFLRMIHSLLRIHQGTPASRETLRQRVGIARLGELSTLLKALSSDEELERYLRGKKLLEKIRVSSVKGGDRLCAGSDTISTL